MTLAVFLVERLPTGDRLVLDGQEGRHAAAVRRFRVGEELRITDGRGAVAQCEVAAAGRDTLDLTVLTRWSDPEPSPRIVVVQALAKGDRGELAVELATEAGADRVVPWRAARSIVKWDEGGRGDKALARWRSTAREAAKQARRSWVPEVTEPVDTAGLVTLIGPGTALILDGDADTRIADASLPLSGELFLIVGPEGGVSEQETDRLVAAGAVPVRLGPTVLRTSTAAAVAIGALGVLTKRWL